MRAIKIDVIKKEVYEVEVPRVNSLESMYRELDVELVEGVRMSRTEMLWVDEEGLRRSPPIGAFKILGYPQALQGHGLIMGLNGPANASSKLRLDEVKAMVQFVDVIELPSPVITMVSFERPEDALEYIKDPSKFHGKASKN